MTAHRKGRVHSSIVGSKPLCTCVGETRTLHLHSGPFGRSQIAPIGLLLLPDSQHKMACTNYEVEIRS